MLAALCLLASPSWAQESDPGAPRAENTTTAEPLASGEDNSDGLELSSWMLRLQKGGIIVLFLFVLSVSGFAFALERLVNLKKQVVVPEALVETVKQRWNGNDFEGIVRACEDAPSTFGRIITEFVHFRHLPPSELDPLAEDITERDFKRHLQKAYPLAVIGAIAPLLGLLGTVFGMIESFEVVAVAGSLGDASLLADGISKALITTAVGLVVAVPMLLFYHYFRNRTTYLAITLEEEVNEVLKEWFYAKTKGNHEG